MLHELLLKFKYIKKILSHNGLLSIDQVNILNKVLSCIELEQGNSNRDNFEIRLHSYLSHDEDKIFGTIFNRQRCLQSDLETMCDISILPKSNGVRILRIGSSAAVEGLRSWIQRRTHVCSCC